MRRAAPMLAVAVALISYRDPGGADLSGLGISVLIAVLVALVLGFAGALEHRRERARTDRPD